MLRLRFVLVCLLVCSCVIPLRVSASPDPLLEGQPISVPLPAGRELSDDELLEVEGEIFWLTALLIGAIAGGVGAGGAVAVHENWFDEDYGIDGDDWGNIGLAAGCGFASIMTSGVSLHYIGPL